MADWAFEMCHANKDFRVGFSLQTMGDAFSPGIPPDRISTLNWAIQGRVKLYAADMTFIDEYGPGERMMITNPEHLAMGKCVLVAASDDVVYYCLREGSDEYLDGEIITLAPGETRTFGEITGKHLFVSDGELIAPKEYPKFTALKFESISSITVTAGDNGAILAIFYKDEN